MADYKELIRRAIQALPENNGASRRAVYEKARAALVGQLRGLDPPLSAREITQHRLQLEDCIRQVEQEASEAVIAGLKQNEHLAGPPRPQASVTPPRPAPIAHAAKTTAEVRSRPVGRAANADAAPHHRAAGPPVTHAAPAHAAPTAKGPVAVPAAVASGGRAVARKPSPEPEEAAPHPAEEPETIEAIIAAAESARAPSPDEAKRATGTPAANDEPDDDIDDAPRGGDNVIALPEPAEPPSFAIAPRSGGLNGTAEARPLPAIVARAEALKTRPSQSARRLSSAGAVARPIGTAMSKVREVALETHPDGDPQIAIERAIATLEREAQNDGDEALNGVDSDAIEARGNDGARRRPADARSPDGVLAADSAFARSTEQERGGGNAITIFLLVFLGLMIVAGGAGFWAWREGYIDFNSMFGRAPQITAKGPETPATPAPKPVAPATPSATETNTEPAPSAPAQSKAELSAAPAAKEPVPSTAPAATPAAPATTSTPAATMTTTAPAAEPSSGVSAAPKSEERLTQSPAAPASAAAPEAAATAATPGALPANPAGGSQSLLLEASQAGTTGAVPFSGTVSWSEGKDELGQPTLVGKADIPARNLAVSVLIRKNSDPTLPASNLMEINFTVGQSFIGGSIAGLPGVLMKNEELVPGTQLIGASARVVGNSFLFALSSSPADEATNRDLLTSRKWLDLAVIYATGKRAILTLEKDDKAQALFTQVFDEWAKEAAAAAPKPADATSK
jgi:hypothetical protein